MPFILNSCTTAGSNMELEHFSRDVSITTFYFRGGQNLNFAVPAEEYAQEREESANR
jgi:hypothetical protein